MSQVLSGQVPSEILLVPRGDAGHFLPAALCWMGKPVTVTADPGGANHVLCLPVLDFVRLGFPEANGRLDLLRPGDAENLRDGRAALLLDLSNEGPGLHGPTFEALHRNLDGLGIPRARVILVSQNPVLRLDYERLYGEGLRFWTFEFFPLQVALWLDAEAGPRLFPQHPVDRAGYAPLARATGPARFLCQNAALRWHRVLLYRWFQLNGLDREGLISFHGIGADNPKAGGINVFHAPPEIAAAFAPLLAGVGDWIPRQARRIDADQGSDMVMTLDTGAYAACDLTVISETDFFELGVERVTEKSLKAAAAGLPFVMVGAPRAVARLSELGFETFGNLIDHYYDLIADPAERLPQVFRSIERAWSACRGDRAGWQRRAREQAEANVAHARRGLLAQLDRVMVRPLVLRLARFAETGEIAR
ncbi:hypothetical protein MMSR116_27610 [Methylobacterium mesophilicum SR1.6/6]|uniref:Glycosyltransferase family 1 protein n=1 Tax=Methylobacterium mesophilicum SR1.6/6 TaxID=908290 RepID=A0A6B9FXN7_9HYPH|nr:hypothetical protein [Methylobacterium mesophilicum]QGY05245.1 hypothetical protein MMSR116_27610 [Methylobacterium mesophilicum SR1.6/6]